MGDSAKLFGGRLDGALDFDLFQAICADPMGEIDAPLAADIEHGVLIYDGDSVREACQSPMAAETLRAELAAGLGHGPGVVLIRDAWSDRSVIDAMTKALIVVIERERDSGDDFDHFGAAGANSRAWDVLGKIAKLDPALHVAYYGNPALDLIAQAWLGPWYQVTAQVNIVHPGGAAQSPHRDYHLGFLSVDDAARFPAHVHQLSQALTLQAGIAHTAMPIEAGPTMVLPGSQRFGAGYLAWRDERFRDYFAEHFVQLELEPGDGLFFNPGLHHGAGENRTENHDRVGNLLQISSAFGVAMESVDWLGIASATYPDLRELHDRGEITDAHIATCASGYAFPSNLDTDVSDTGLAPASMQALLRQALDDGMAPDRFRDLLESKAQARQPF